MPQLNPQHRLRFSSGRKARRGSEGKTTEETVRTSTEGDHIVSNVHRPSLTLFLPAKEKATGAAVVIIPGGGHVELWMDHEGCRIGQWMSDHGIAGFVLKYRLSRAAGSTYTIDGHSLPDVQRALRLVRSHAHVWGVDPERIGVIGFSRRWTTRRARQHALRFRKQKRSRSHRT